MSLSQEVVDYKSAGVDVEAGYKSVELMKKHVEKTFRSEVLSGLGGFGGMFSIARAKDFDDPVLVSGTDGVGTKIKLAFVSGKHDTIGIDCVAMCVNDILCCGAEPLYFLDYIGCNKNKPKTIEMIVKGITDGCVAAGCALIGGETAEMPDIYSDNEYDLAGFAVGIVEKGKMIDGSKIKEGDTVIGIASSGIHSNGYALVRKIFRPTKETMTQNIDSLGETLGEALLAPTKIYVKPILDLIKRVEVKGMSHITGGGFIENIPRALPKGLKAVINKGSWSAPPIFEMLKTTGRLTSKVMYNTFNMGIGMVLTVSKEDAEKTVSIIEEFGEKAYVIGEIAKDGEEKGIELC